MSAPVQCLALFIFFYPMLMSILWMTGGIFFYARCEWKIKQPPALSGYPPVTILIAAHNEALVIGSTVANLFQLEYPEYEVIVVDDGSTDGTTRILTGMAANERRLRLVLLLKNLGKPAALNAGVRAARHEIIVTMDADSYLDRNALHWLIWHFEKSPRTGAVTGNPRVLNRTSLLARIQAAEYSSIIGMIKRTQRIWGKVMTVSGALAAFRMTALADVNFWSTDSVTEDIDITWKLQKHFWEIRYEPRALVWILVPETLQGLWKQRLRWSRGGIEALRKNHRIFKDLRQRRLWPIFLDSLAATCWAALFFLFSLGWLAGPMLPTPLIEVSPLTLWWGAALLMVCLLQFAIAVRLDRRYDRTLNRTYFWVIWYPVAYWFFNCLVTVCALPRGLFGRLGSRIRVNWVSPDRGYVSPREVA